jgi:phage terminase small subunit
MPVLKNARHELFIQGVVKGISPGPAYTAAGYEVTGNSAESAAARLFRNVQVKERYAELMAPAIEATGATVERVLKEMVRLAFYDMTAILDSANGRIAMKDPRELPEDLRRAIVAIKPVEVGEELHYECKFADKQKALDSLARYLQMFKDTLVVENVFRVVQEMDDDELDRRLAELERAYGEATTLDPPTGEGPKSIH